MKRIVLRKGYALSFFATAFGRLYEGNCVYPGRLKGEEVYLVRVDTTRYTIETEDGEVVDNVELRNGVAYFKYPLTGTYLHTIAQYGLAELNQGIAALLVASMKEALDKAVKKQPGEYYKVLQKLLGVGEETTHPEKGSTEPKSDKPVEPDGDAAVLLRTILANCPKARIEWVNAPRVRELRHYTHVPRNVPECVTFLRLLRYLRCTAGSKNEGGEWYYTSNQREYNALVMMQSYSPDISSCQYFPVHALSSEEARAIVENYSTFKPLLPKCKDSLEEGKMETFLVNQWRGFEKGVKYYFQLGGHGLISKRFYVFGDERKISNNFYHVTGRPCTITYGDGSVAVVRPFQGDCPGALPVYMNDALIEATLPDELTEASVRKYLTDDC